MKRFTILVLSASAIMAQVPATAAPATAPVTATAAEEAPLAPISTQLLQNHPGAPKSIDDVLLVPSASAGQKAVAFQWSGANDAQAYILWKNYFAAAQYTGFPTQAPTTDTTTPAKTIASFGLMYPTWGAGVSLAYADHYSEPTTTTPNTTRYEALNQIKLFGSVGLDGKDVYGSLLWKKPISNTVTEPTNGSKFTLPRTDTVLLSGGIRKYPAAGVEGLAWNGTAGLGYVYVRMQRGDNSEMIWLANAAGQVGYVFITDGIEFLPGVDAYVNYANGVANPDYGYRFGVSPYAALLLPIFEHWTLKGGARYNVEQTVQDQTPGKPSTFEDQALITNTYGSVGLRYARNRWAFEGSIANSFLTNGPYFISGATTGGLVGSLALTVNLK